MKQHGSIMTIFMIAIPVLIVCSLGIGDIVHLEMTKARMQAAADAAALAGAQFLPDEYKARARALTLATDNGFDPVQNEVITAKSTRYANAYQVDINRDMPSWIFKAWTYHPRVTATAQTLAPVMMNITGDGEYGATDAVSLSLFGPQGRYDYGDAYSTLYLNNGEPNSHYQENGYNFYIDIPDDYATRNKTSLLKIEIFDPGCWNIGNVNDAGSGRIDEIRDPYPGNPWPDSRYTQTRYRLCKPDPEDIAGDVIAQATYRKDTSDTDMQWVSPTGFTVDLTHYGYGGFVINVKSLDGSSENGFNLRAGPPLEDGAEFDPGNGTEISAIGRLPINFFQNTAVNIALGYVPPEAAGNYVCVDKFDTDVGSKSIVYRDNLGNSWPGKLAGNGYFVTDTLDIPEGYPGSDWTAEYVAGAQDTSSWAMFYAGEGMWRGEGVHLVE